MKSADLLKNIYHDFTRLTPENLGVYKRIWSKSLGYTPKNSQILSAYKMLVRNGKLKRNSTIEQILRLKSVRSESGVTPMAVMTKPFPCPGRCIYCPLHPSMPKSYLPDEPAAQRALNSDFDPLLQITERLKQLHATGHHTGKVELIVIGGTFSAYPKAYRYEFFKRMIEACNGFESKNLLKAQIANESAKQRIVGISIETRPDWIDEDEVKFLRELGVTKVQLGVQTFDASILKKIKRGHSIRPVARATLLLRNAGFKICYHFMPNLPGSTPKKDAAMARVMYEDRRFKPDFVKIYPTQVIPNTELYQMWQSGEFKTYDDDTLKKVLIEIKLATPNWVRIDRLVRDISKDWVASGTAKTNLRQIIQKELKKIGKSCRCIRCREVRQPVRQGRLSFSIEEVDVVGGRELFLTFSKAGSLYSLLRLRLPNKKQIFLFPELRNCALIREIHTFGRSVPIHKKIVHQPQHRGLGTRLLKKAETLAREAGFMKLAVISAIGTRNYYRKKGYRLIGCYMVKNI